MWAQSSTQPARQPTSALFHVALQFSASSIHELFRIVLSKPLDFPAAPSVSPQLKDLLTQMLHKVSETIDICRPRNRWLHMLAYMFSQLPVCSFRLCREHWPPGM